MQILPLRLDGKIFELLLKYGVWVHMFVYTLYMRFGYKTGTRYPLIHVVFICPSTIVGGEYERT